VEVEAEKLLQLSKRLLPLRQRLNKQRPPQFLKKV
jgi:hypothetical protein